MLFLFLSIVRVMSHAAGYQLRQNTNDRVWESFCIQEGWALNSQTFQFLVRTTEVRNQCHSLKVVLEHLAHGHVLQRLFVWRQVLHV